MRPKTVKEARLKPRRGKVDIYQRYRSILNQPQLSKAQIEEMRKHLGRLVQTICEHVWGQQFY